MSRKSKFTKEQKIELVKRYDNGEGSFESLAKDFNVGCSTLKSWVHKYHTYGESAFDFKKKNSSYTKEFKEEVVQAYLNGEGSYQDLALKYNIASHSSILNWVMVYNNPEGLKDYCPQGDVYKMKSRKTKKEERIEIVKYCLDHDKDYKTTAKVFNVPYANVYNWVKKYIENGDDGLGDNRGHHKSDEEVDEITLLKRKLERAERERDIAMMENHLLKKVEEIERRRFLERAALNQNIKPSKKQQRN
jgi:transposase-like protein